jgi:O-antigen/teichoic acid export membrane protein
VPTAQVGIALHRSDTGELSVSGTSPVSGFEAKPPAPARRSLTMNAAVRLIVDVSGFMVGTMAAIVTARWLGPADRGTFSAITYVAGLIAAAATLGLGDAAIVEINRRGISLGRAVSATTAAVLILGAAGAALLVAVLHVMLASTWGHVRTAVLLAALGVPITTIFLALTQVVNAGERIVLTSMTALAVGLLNTAALAVFIPVLGLGLTGGVVATIGASAIGVGVLILALGHQRRHLRPRWDREYLSRAARFGLAIQVATILWSLTGRADLIVVYMISGHAWAGEYSIALTLSMITAYAAHAIIYGGFPRLAGLSRDDARMLTGRMFRVGVVVAAGVGLLLAAAAPFIVPLAFGSTYGASVLPTVLLMPGAILYSGQLILTRAAAADGDPKLLVRSFGVNTAVMLLLDALAVPLAGTTGAAIASSLGSAVGLWVCLAHFARLEGSWRSAKSMFLPGKDDLALIIHLPQKLLEHRAAAARRRVAHKTSRLSK